MDESQMRELQEDSDIAFFRADLRGNELDK